MEYLLTYAGVPFVSDQGRVFRMDQGGHALGNYGENTAPKKHQPDNDLIDEINRLIPMMYMDDFAPPSAYPGKNLSNIAHSWTESTPQTHVRIGDWFYPYGAGRWSVFRGLAASTQVKDMLAACGGTNPATFVMKSTVEGASQSSASRFTLSSSMYMLPPRPLGEHGGQFDGLYLVTLVDERFHWQNNPGGMLTVNHDTTWQNLLDEVADALGITITLGSSIESTYSQPDPDCQLWCRLESVPVLIDAICYNIGRSFVRNLDGTYVLLTPGQSAARVSTNRGNIRNLVRTAGGDIFASGGKIKAGNLFKAKNTVIPTNIVHTFPKYITGDDPVPHYSNLRYTNQRPTSWYEDSYGDVHTITVPMTSGGLSASGQFSTSGLAADGDYVIHNTAKALYSGEIYSSGLPYNNSGLTALAMQLTRDFYGSQLAAAVDEVYPGTVNLSLEGMHDVIWTYSARARQATTRVMRTEWNEIIHEMQHAAPAMSGWTNTPKGVGGHSVAQSWVDGASFSGWVVSLQKSMASGDYFAVVDDVVYIPTQNRWRGYLNNEAILFEGTSGGVAVTTVSGVDVSGGFRIDIARRAIDGTLLAEHQSGGQILQTYPAAAYGVNFVRHEKGQFVYPQEWTSGGIQGVNVVPQTQTVYAYSAAGTTINGVTHYSGRLKLGDTTANVNSGQNYWRDQEYVWIVNRNSGQGLKSGGQYDGQYIGVSAHPPFPTYAVNSERVVKEVICLPDGGLSVTYGNT